MLHYLKSAAKHGGPMHLEKARLYDTRRVKET